MFVKNVSWLAASVMLAGLIAGCGGNGGGSADDPYENNDTLATAWDFSLGEGILLSTYGGAMGIQSDEDWYEIEVTAGETRVLIDCTFTHAEGDIDIDLYNSAGTPLAYSNSGTDDEHIDYDVIVAGTYYICVYYDDAGNSYDLWWDDEVPPPEDSYEENDTLATAWDFSLGEGILLSTYGGEMGIQLDEDWYEIEVTAGETRVLIDCIFTHAEGDIDIDLYDGVGTPLAYSDSMTDDEHINYDVGAAGTYYICVYYDDAGNSYDLWWDDKVSLEDSYEENDTLATAWDFSLGEGILLSTYGGEMGIQADEDWYEIDVTTDETLVTIDCTFTHTEGDIDIDLYDSGGTLLAYSVSSTDDEHISYNVAADGYTGGTFYICVYYGDAGNAYDLSWDDEVPPEDSYEENDTLAAAWDFSLGEGSLLSSYGGEMGRQSDEDWYEIDVTAGETRVLIDCIFTHAEGDIDIDLYDSGETLLISSTSVTDDELINYDVIVAGTYYICVYWGNAGNAYDLWWDDVDPLTDGYEPNDTLAAAYYLGSYTDTYYASALIDPSGDEDWFYVTQTGGYTLTISLDNLPANYDLYLYDDTGTPLDSSTNSGTTGESIVFPCVTAGDNDYYIQVVGFAGASSDTVMYELTVDVP